MDWKKGLICFWLKTLFLVWLLSSTYMCHIMDLFALSTSMPTIIITCISLFLLSIFVQGFKTTVDLCASVYVYQEFASVFFVIAYEVLLLNEHGLIEATYKNIDNIFMYADCNAKLQAKDQEDIAIFLLEPMKALFKSQDEVNKILLGNFNSVINDISNTLEKEIEGHNEAQKKHGRFKREGNNSVNDNLLYEQYAKKVEERCKKGLERPHRQCEEMMDRSYKKCKYESGWKGVFFGDLVCKPISSKTNCAKLDIKNICRSDKLVRKDTIKKYLAVKNSTSFFRDFFSSNASVEFPKKEDYKTMMKGLMPSSYVRLSFKFPEEFKNIFAFMSSKMFKKILNVFRSLIEIATFCKIISMFRESYIYMRSYMTDLSFDNYYITETLEIYDHNVNLKIGKSIFPLTADAKRTYKDMRKDRAQVIKKRRKKVWNRLFKLGTFYVFCYAVSWVFAVMVDIIRTEGTIDTRLQGYQLMDIVAKEKHGGHTGIFAMFYDRYKKEFHLDTRYRNEECLPSESHHIGNDQLWTFLFFFAGYAVLKLCGTNYLHPHEIAKREHKNIYYRRVRFLHNIMLLEKFEL